jgi:pimeloyl-ACP methyl ester carboxylesterase
MAVDLEYVESGQGPVVVLLHAYPLDASMWDAQRASLSDRFRVIAPHLRGFGGSPLGDDAPNLNPVADDVAALMDRLGIEQAGVVGLSLGGYVAMAMLRRHRPRIQALALIDTKATADDNAGRSKRERIADTLDAEGSVRVLLDEAVPGLLGATTHATRPEVLDQVRTIVSGVDPAAAAWMQRAMATRPDSVATLEDFDGPTLVVVGAEDGVTPPEQAEIMFDALPDSELAVLPECGHLSALERPDDIAELLGDLLDGLAAGA